MSVEVFGDREFVESVQELDGVWVLLAGHAAYALPSESGRALPVWSSAEKAELFAQSLGQLMLSPVFVPLGIFLGTAWLGSSSMKITDVLASPKYGQESLTYTADEIRARFRT
jgi:hypothetical protein